MITQTKQMTQSDKVQMSWTVLAVARMIYTLVCAIGTDLLDHRATENVHRVNVTSTGEFQILF